MCSRTQIRWLQYIKCCTVCGSATSGFTAVLKLCNKLQRQPNSLSRLCHGTGNYCFCISRSWAITSPATCNDITVYFSTIYKIRSIANSSGTRTLRFMFLVNCSGLGCITNYYDMLS